jgi:hypothetical protein
MAKKPANHPVKPKARSSKRADSPYVRVTLATAKLITAIAKLVGALAALFWAVGHVG